jgi:hypothetical protein
MNRDFKTSLETQWTHLEANVSRVMSSGSSNRHKRVMRREGREPLCQMFMADEFVLQMGIGMVIATQDA